MRTGAGEAFLRGRSSAGNGGIALRVRWPGRERALRIAAAALLFALLFAQIGMLSRISQRSKQASALEGEIVRLRREIDHLELNINQLHNLEKIAARAREMGMAQPEEKQIRVICVNQAHMKDTSTQPAANGSGEKIFN